MRQIIAVLLLASLASAQTIEERLDALESRVTVLEDAVGIPVPHPTPAVPSTWYDEMGVPVYLVGHEFNVWAVKGGSWNDPATWSSGTVPTKVSTVVVTNGRTVSLDGVVQAKTILAYGGHVRVLDGADITVSTIMGVNGAKWTAGSGDDGDILMKITAGGSTHTITLVDFSAAA